MVVESYGICACCDNPAIIYYYDKNAWVCAEHYVPTGLAVSEQRYLEVIQRTALYRDILFRLSDVLPKWQSECDCYSVRSMRQFEQEIEATLSLGMAERKNTN